MDKIDIPRATYAGYLRPKRLGDLHRKGAHASRSAVDQDLLSRLNVAFVTKALQRGDCRHRDRSRLLKCHIRRLQNDCSVRQDAHVLGDGPILSAEHLIAGFEVGDVLANCFDGPGVVDT